MKARTYSSEGVILANRNYSEADRIVIILTEKYGKKSFLAKSVRKPTSRKRGSLEVFNYIRFSAVGRRSLDLITEVETINTYPKIRKNLNRIALGYYFVEVIGRTTRDEEVNAEILSLLTAFLTRLETAGELKNLKMEFVGLLLEYLGFWPRGKVNRDPDKTLAEVLEKKPYSQRVGKKLLS